MDEQVAFQRRFNDPVLRTKVPWRSRSLAVKILEDPDCRSFLWSIAEEFIRKYPAPPDGCKAKDLLAHLITMAKEFMRLFFANDVLDRLYKP